MRSSLLIGLLFAAASAPAVFAAATASGPIVKDGVEIILLPTVSQAGGPAGVTQVDFDLEARTDEAAHRLGFRSLHGTTAVDCHLGANRFLKADVYDQPSLKGPSRPRTVTGAWVHPNADSYMFAVTQRICASTAAPAAPAPLQRVAAAPGPLPVVTAQALPPAAAPAPPVAAATQVAMTPARPSPAPVRMASAAPPATHAPVAPTSAASWTGKPAGKGVAQVAAAGTAKDAQRVLNALHGLIAPPLTQTVEQATVQNATLFRASVVGFASLTRRQGLLRQGSLGLEDLLGALEGGRAG